MVAVSYLTDLRQNANLLQNATDFIEKCNSYFTTKCDKSLLQYASIFLLQNKIVLLKIQQLL